jgi:glutathione S-transferase
MRMTPIVQIDDLTMVESGAIVEYLLLRFGEGRFRPDPASKDMAAYLQWLHFAEGSGMARGQIERLVLQLTNDDPPADLAYVYVGTSRRVLDFAEATLAQTPYFAGDAFTAADLMMHFPLRVAGLAVSRIVTTGAIFDGSRVGLQDYPAINAHLDRVEARPAFRRAMATTMPDGPPSI